MTLPLGSGVGATQSAVPDAWADGVSGACTAKGTIDSALGASRGTAGMPIASSSAERQKLIPVTRFSSPMTVTPVVPPDWYRIVFFDS